MAELRIGGTKYAPILVKKVEVTPDLYAKKIVNENGELVFDPSVTTFKLDPRVTTLNKFNILSYSEYGNNILTSADFSNLETISGSSACEYMFYGCYSLESINLSNLETISGNSACYHMFDNCSSLVSADLSSLTTISGQNACLHMFQNCKNLTSVTFGNENTEIDFGTYKNQFEYIFSGCSQNITLNIASKQKVLKEFDGYDLNGACHHFGCSGIVTINYLADCKVSLNITGTWSSIYIENTKETYDSSTTEFYIPKNTDVKYYIITQNSFYIGIIPAQTSSTYTLNIDLTTVSYNTITLQPDNITTFISGKIKIGNNSVNLNEGSLYANIYNTSGESVNIDYLYVQSGCKPAIGSTTYTSGDKIIPLTMVTGNPVWVESIDGQLYPWRVAETVVAPEGYELYESTNKQKPSTLSVSKLCFIGTDFTCYINSYGEASFDYTIISKADTDRIPTQYSSANVKAHTYGNPKDPSVFPANYTKVEYTGLTDQLHYVYIVYCKDVSSDRDNDRGYVAFQ